MIEKRFAIKPQDDLFGINDNNVGMNVINGILTEIEAKWLCDLMNELNEEKENLKHMCSKNVSENSILWKEIFILMEQGAEPSDAFQQYLDSISNEYDKFWQRKLKKARKDGVILNDK